MTSILNVPYTGQVGIGTDEHGNDCGAASVSMIIKYSGLVSPNVDSLYNEAKITGDNYLSYGDLLGMLSRRNIDSDYVVSVATKDLFWILTDAIAPIALIRYGALSSIRPNNFSGSHFVVVIGMDLDTVYIHDPLNTPSTGQGVKIPLKIWETAWSTVEDDNPQRSLLVPAKAVGVSTITTVLRYVSPRDTDGINVRLIPGDLTLKNKLYSIAYGTKIPIYIERDGWGKIDANSEKWISTEYTKTWE
jgi:hypothetical protein